MKHETEADFFFFYEIRPQQIDDEKVNLKYLSTLSSVYLKTAAREKNKCLKYHHHQCLNVLFELKSFLTFCFHNPVEPVFCWDQNNPGLLH